MAGCVVAALVPGKDWVGVHASSAQQKPSRAIMALAVLGPQVPAL
jgi:hypothetical protein